MHALARLLRPRSIAVIGGAPAAAVIRANRRLGYTGALWPVHPTQTTIEGLPAFASLADLPAPPDAAFIAVNRHQTVEIIKQLEEIGAGGAAAYAAGFAEAGPEGAVLQAALREAAGAMPVLGPNCYGCLNYLDGAALWPDQHGGARVARGVAIVTQSGNIGCNISMQRRALPLGLLITLGNQAVTGLAKTIAALCGEPRITAIGLHVEGLDDAEAFAASAARARAAGKPIVALVTGTSAAGARLAVSHTASLAGGDAVTGAFLRRLGVARVDSIPALLETLKLLHVIGPLRGRSLVSLSCSGGEAALIADRAAARRLALRPFAVHEQAAIAMTLPPLVAISNPLDYHTFSWANRAALEATFVAVLRCGFDFAALVLDFPREDRCDPADWDIAADAWCAAAERTARPAAIITTLGECMPEARAEAIAAAGIVPLLGVDEALAAIEAAADLGGPLPAPPLLTPARGNRAVTREEFESKRALAACGVAVPDGRLARSPGGAVVAARELGFPVVLKSVGLAHKTEHGAVRVGLASEAAVAAAASELAAPLLVERMIADGVAEIIAGVARDPAIGPYLLLGSGGILAELIGDRAILMLPAEAADIRAAVLNLKVGALLTGHRGRPAGDLDALVAAVLAMQSYALAHLDRLIELDVNPLIVRPRGRGAVAVDALIRTTEETAP
jgi:acyl-CoA synthetase (NDP forming)